MPLHGRGVYNSRMAIRIAIDGPVASGKTVVGMELARRLGCAFLDTGLMYRAVAWAALGQGVSTDDESAVAALARRLEMRPLDDSSGRLLVDGEDATDYLRLPDVERVVPGVAAMPQVRVALIARQREIAAQASVVMVGRDIGSVVIPNAQVKLFLTASVETRAQRRHSEQLSKGAASSLEDVTRSVERRDRLDAAQSEPAIDATEVETDDMSISEIVTLALRLAEERR